jgi:hypothetical protein
MPFSTARKHTNILIYFAGELMESPNLIYICATAFAGVFILLTVLAILMRLIILIFPEKALAADAAIMAAITSTYNTLYPGTKITQIKEEK